MVQDQRTQAIVYIHIQNDQKSTKKFMRRSRSDTASDQPQMPKRASISLSIPHMVPKPLRRGESLRSQTASPKDSSPVQSRILDMVANNLEVSAGSTLYIGKKCQIHENPHDSFGPEGKLTHTQVDDPKIFLPGLCPNPHGWILLGYDHTHLTGDCRSLLVCTSTTPDTLRTTVHSFHTAVALQGLPTYVCS